MLRVWVHGCDPGRVSDGSRLALCQNLSIECPSSNIIVSFSLSFLSLFVFFFCSRWSCVDVPLIFFCPADHVPDWQPRILLGMVEARSVNVKQTTTQEEDHTGFLLLSSAVLALIFLARRIHPFLSLVDREVEFCVLKMKRAFFLSFVFIFC